MKLIRRSVCFTATASAAMLLASCAGNMAASTPRAQVQLRSSASTASGDAKSYRANEAPLTHNTWQYLQSMPTKRTAAAAGVVGNKLYVVGGYYTGPLNTNSVYDFSTNSWSTAAPMPTARYILTAAVVNGMLYAIGGKLAGNDQTNLVEAYDPATNTWSTKSPMPTARDSLAAVVDQGEIYVIGGYNASSGRLANVEKYDPPSDTWTVETPMNVARSGVGAGVVGTLIVAASGLSNSGLTTDNEEYDPSSNAWTELTPSPTAQNVPCAAGGAGYVALAGGTDANNNAQSILQLYNLATDSWSTGAPMLTAVVGAGEAVSGGRLLCAGGSNHGSPMPGFRFYNTLQAYQP